MSSGLTIWCNAKLPAEALAQLKEGVGGRQLVMAERVVNNIEPSHVDAKLPEADVAFGQPDPGQIMASGRLRWVQLSSAGYARYDRGDLRAALVARGAVLSNSSSVFSEACAQHAMAFLLARARQIGAAAQNQFGARDWPGAELRKRSRLLTGQSVLILGFGAIGRRLAELLGPLGMKLTAVRRQVRGDEGIAVRTVGEVDALLGQTDHVVNILPASEGTDRFFDSGRFSKMNRGACFYNIGRGATVDQTALREALVSGQVGAAFLDVTSPEPLPSGDLLWTAPNLLITPHTAGGAVDEFERVVGHFLQNLARFDRGEKLRDRIV